MGTDRNGNRDRKWPFLCAALVLLLALAVSFFLDFFLIDISKITDILPEAVRGSIEEILGFFLPSGNKISVTGFGAAETVFRQKGGSFPDSLTRDMRVRIGLLILIPYILILFGTVMLALGRAWSGIVSAVSSVCAAGFQLWSTFRRLPQAFYDLIPEDFLAQTGNAKEAAGVVGLFGELIGNSGITETASKAEEMIDSISPQLFVNIVKNSLGPGWFLLLICGGVLLICSVVLAVRRLSGRKRGKKTSRSAAAREEGRGNPAGADPRGMDPDREYALICEFGEMKGARIPLVPGKPVLIGTDPGQCNLILPAPGVEAVHCLIECGRKYGSYYIQNFSEKGLWDASGEREVPPGGSNVPSGTRIYLGSSDNPVFLE